MRRLRDKPELAAIGGVQFSDLVLGVGLDIWKANHGPHFAVRACFKVEENG